MNPSDVKCISIRRFAGMALTNLTFGDGNNKALLCANREFMEALVAQINTDSDALLQVTANVLRNLSWRADNNMKAVLNELGTVTALTVAAIRNKNETTLRTILSALWNSSAHCSKNKLELCLVDGALLFLVEMLTYDAPSGTLSIIENAGGILHNVSSHIAVNEEFRKILRQRNCLSILVQQLRSPSLTIVSNACGTLWNLSARCPEDQKMLWDCNAVPMLRSLINSKHKMISRGSKIALKNLLNYRPGEINASRLDPVAKMMGLQELPTLSARKQRAFESVLDENLTDEKIEATKTPSSLINHKATKSLSANELDQGYTDGDSDYSSLQCKQTTSTKLSNDERSHLNNPKTKNDFWLVPYSNEHHAIELINLPALPHPTGTIPKRKNRCEADDTDSLSNKEIASSTTKQCKDESADENTAKNAEADSDQITNFSLLYAENHSENRDATTTKLQKERTFSVAEEDTIKCYDNEGTPHTLLSTATSISDLRPISKHSNLHKISKSGRTTTENSGINTPEKPIVYYYCDNHENDPTYFNRRDSFNSVLNEETVKTQGSIEDANKPNQLDMATAHTSNESTSGISVQRNDENRQTSENDSSNNCTVPTTPGECASKSVTFNEFNLETPMMFSRHTSLGSLASQEPAMNDDIASVVSEIR